MLALILYMIADAGRRGYRPLLDAFWDECRVFGIPLASEDPVSPVAFCNARKKVPPVLILGLLHQASQEFDARFGDRFLLKGHRVFAVDGTKVQVTRSPELFAALGAHGNGYNPQMLESALYNVISKVVYDVRVAPTHSSERDELRSMLASLQPGDILTLDRGYPAFDLFTELLERGVHPVVRLPASTFPAVEEFVKSGETDGWVTITPPRRFRARYESLRMRVVVFPGKGSDRVVLITDLSASEFSWLEMSDVYHLRWGAEELYKLGKGDYLGQGQFHSKSLDGLKQEVYALGLFVTIVRTATAAAAEVSGEPYEDIYQKTAVLAVAEYVTRLTLGPQHGKLEEVTAHLLHRIARNIVPPRPDRSFARRSYRPRPPWTPKGKKR